MPGPFLRPVRRTLGKASMLAVIAIVVAASAARSAEVAIAEVEGTANAVTVEQGGSATFTLELRASGWIRCSSSPADPATAVFDSAISIGPDASITAGGTPAAVSFYAEPNGGTLCRVTWPGDPAPERIQLTVTADRDAPLGDHAYWPRAVLTTPPGSGDRLEDRTRTMLTFTVVPGSDAVPPSVTCSGPQGTQGDNGWYVSAVHHPCTASDEGSGLAAPSDASFTLATGGEGTTWTGTHTVQDAAGNASSAGPFGPYNVDLGDPVGHVAVPAPGAVFVLGQDVSASYGCSDGVSGVASCDGGTVDTSTVGSKTFAVHAADHAGRTTLMERAYEVVFGFSWSHGSSKPQKAGSAMPLSWSLDGVTDPGSFVAADSTPCGGGASEPAVTQGSGSPSYSPGTQAFHLVVKSDGSWRGTCRTVRVHLSDGTARGFDVDFT